MERQIALLDENNGAGCRKKRGRPGRDAEVVSRSRQGRSFGRGVLDWTGPAQGGSETNRRKEKVGEEWNDKAGSEAVAAQGQ